VDRNFWTFFQIKYFHRSIQELAPQLKCLAIYGGTNYESQVGPLKRKVDVVCATPGRLRDLIQRKEFVTDDIEIICLDEADELLRPNFMVIFFNNFFVSIINLIKKLNRIKLKK